MQEGLAVDTEEKIARLFVVSIINERKPPAFRLINKIDLLPDKVHSMFFVDIHYYSVNFIGDVRLLFPVKPDHECHTPATATFDAYTEAVIAGNAFRVDDIADLLAGATRDGYWTNVVKHCA